MGSLALLAQVQPAIGHGKRGFWVGGGGSAGDDGGGGSGGFFRGRPRLLGVVTEVSGGKVALGGSSRFVGVISGIVERIIANAWKEE